MAEFTKAANFEVSTGEYEGENYIYFKAVKGGVRIAKNDFAKMCRFAARAGHPYFKYKGFAFEVNENTPGEIDEFFIRLEERIDCGAFVEEGSVAGRRLRSDDIDFDFTTESSETAGPSETASVTKRRTSFAAGRNSLADDIIKKKRGTATGEDKDLGITIKKVTLRPVSIDSASVMIAEKAEMWTVKFNEQDYGIFSIPVALQIKRRDNKAINQITQGFSDACEGKYGNPVYLSQRNWIFRADSAKEAEKVLLAFREYLLRSLYLWEIKGSIVASDKVNDTSENMDYSKTAKEWPMPFVHNVEEISPETLAAARNSVIK